jgi:hypothetical protein
MSAGFYSNNACVTVNAAMNHYAESFSKPGNNLFISQSVTATGLATYSFHDIAGNVDNVSNMQLIPCDTADFSSPSDYNYVDAAAMWSFAFSSVFMLWWLSRNIGIVVNAVRRF